MPRLPVNITGTFGYALLLTFSPGNLPLHEYALEDKSDDAGKLVLKFETKKDQQEIKWDINGDIRVAKDAGKGWIDPAAMQVDRIERNLLNLPRSHPSWKITIDQNPVTIGEKQFWLPKSFRTEVAEQDSRKINVFLAQYSDCKKFTTEISIRP
jgi:hypothetical protein